MSESDETRAEQALDIMRRADTARIETKAEIPSAVLDVSGRDASILFSLDTLDLAGDVTSLKAFNRSIGLGVHRIGHQLMHEGPCIGVIQKIETIAQRDLPADIQRDYPGATGGMVAISRMLKAGTGADVYQGIIEGVPYGASFGFIPQKAIPHPTIKRPDGRPARWLQDLHLIEVTTALPGTGIHPGARSYRAEKVLDYLSELKAGRRHSGIDQDWLNQIVALALSLGAELPTDPAQPETARTSALDALIDEIGSLYEVA